MASRKRTLKRLRTTGGWVLFLIVLIFVAEWVSRGLQDKIMDPETNPHLAFDPATGYLYKPHYTQDVQNPAGERVVIDINSLGLRDREISGRTGGQIRIAGLGGSFTAATQVNQSDTYLRQMETLAERAGQPSPLTVNAGIDGYGLDQCLALLKKYGRQMEPDIVLLGVYVGTDVRAYGEAKGLAIPGKKFLKKHSYLYHLIRRGYYGVKGGKDADAGADPAEMARWRQELMPFGEPPDDETLERFVRNAGNEVSIFREEGIPEATRSATGDVLLGIREEAERRGAKMVIALLPTRLQIVPMDLVRASALLDFDSEGFDLARPQRVLKEMADRLQVPVVDLLPAFRSYPAPESLYFEGYRYWNENGHRLAAEVIYRFLEEGRYNKN